MFDTGGGWG
ncbi:hypothetical protein D039_3892A, partial [Vibrio parahaemolyticus EKP-028]